METTAKVLETMRSAGKPVSAGEVATSEHPLPMQLRQGDVLLITTGYFSLL